MGQVLNSGSGDSEPSAAVVRQAAEWLAHIESGDASEQDYRDLDEWRLAAPAHALALDRLGGMRARMDAAPLVERETLRRLLTRPKRLKGRAFLSAVTLVGVGWMTLQLPIVQLHFADQKTPPGETRVLELTDGSRLTLSSDSAVNINVGGDRRTIRLLRGEVLAQVAKQDGGSFEVKSADGVAVALGTAFTVRKEADSTTVAVAESHVRVCPTFGAGEACVTLAPGQRGRLTARKVERLADVSATNIGAWAEGWLAVDDQPLADVLDELNRWRQDQISFDRRALADLRVSGVFPLRDPDRSIANLSQLLPITVDRGDPSAPVIRRR